MAVDFVAIIDANNAPVYFYSREKDLEIRNQFIAEMALDFVDTQFAHQNSGRDSLLLVHDGEAVYGNLSNTNTKILLGINAHTEAEMQLDAVFRKIQDLYIAHINNPFYDESKPTIQSGKFDKNVEECLSS